MASSRVMFFIDGTWLWHNMMSQKQRTNTKLNLYKLPLEILKVLPYRTSLKQITISASLPRNVDARDEKLVKKRERFFNLLYIKCEYTLDIYWIDFQGRRLLKKDRHPNDSWEPKEKYVDISVTSNLLYHAACNNYDEAVVITGDKDFIPALIKANWLNKGITIATFRNSCSYQLAKMYNTIFIDDIIDRVILD